MTIYKEKFYTHLYQNVAFGKYSEITLAYFTIVRFHNFFIFL